MADVWTKNNNLKIGRKDGRTMEWNHTGGMKNDFFPTFYY